MLIVVLNVTSAAVVPTEILDMTNLLVVNEHEGLIVAKGMGIAVSDAISAAREIAYRTKQACVVTLRVTGLSRAMQLEHGGFPLFRSSRPTPLRRVTVSLVGSPRDWLRAMICLNRLDGQP